MEHNFQSFEAEQLEGYLHSLDDDCKVINLRSYSLTSLPDLSRFTQLQILYCDSNRLTVLPENLPNTLRELSCNDNVLISLPNNLPKYLLYLYCSNNRLTSLPENLPDTLKEIWVFTNRLTSLPDNLPKSLEFLNANDLSSQFSSLYLHYVYPELRKFNRPLKPEHIQYIQKINIDKQLHRERNIKKCKEWLSVVNKNNIFLELYERRIMNPKKLQHLANNEEINIDTFLGNYQKYV
jgi:hypothetical protein